VSMGGRRGEKNQKGGIKKRRGSQKKELCPRDDVNIFGEGKLTGLCWPTKKRKGGKVKKGRRRKREEKGVGGEPGRSRTPLSCRWPSFSKKTRKQLLQKRFQGGKNSGGGKAQTEGKSKTFASGFTENGITVEAMGKAQEAKGKGRGKERGSVKSKFHLMGKALGLTLGPDGKNKKKNKERESGSKKKFP